jgi:hypothetical protein
MGILFPNVVIRKLFSCTALGVIGPASGVYDNGKRTSDRIKSDRC